MLATDKYVYVLCMFVCLHSHLGLFCNLDLYGQPLQKPDTIFIIQILHSGQYLYMYCRWTFSYAEVRIGIILAGLTLPHFCAWNSNVICREICCVP